MPKLRGLVGETEREERREWRRRRGGKPAAAGSKTARTPDVSHGCWEHAEKREARGEPVVGRKNQRADR